MALRETPFARVQDVDRPGVDPPYYYPDYVGTRLRAPKEPLVLMPHTCRSSQARRSETGRSASSTTT